MGAPAGCNLGVWAVVAIRVDLGLGRHSRTRLRITGSGGEAGGRSADGPENTREKAGGEGDCQGGCPDLR